jgi:protein-S-isoprenylcysteine O-methyltransferase Ste14
MLHETPVVIGDCEAIVEVIMISYSMKDRILRKLSAYRTFAYIPPFIFMMISSYGEIEHDYIIWPLGISIVLLGASVRVWSTKHIGRRIVSMKKKGKMLVRTGPYAIVRNPLYIGNILIATGLSILSELIWLVPFLLIYFFLLNHFVVLYEEKKLLTRWGDEYQTYLNEVPRWVPRVRERHGIKGDGFTWTRAVKAEVPSLFVILFGVAIFVFKDYINHIK